MQLILMLVGAFARALLLSWSGVLIERHILTPEQGTRLVVEGVHYALLATPGLLALGWSFWQKYRHQAKVERLFDMAQKALYDHVGYANTYPTRPPTGA